MAISRSFQPATMFKLYRRVLDVLGAVETRHDTLHDLSHGHLLQSSQLLFTGTLFRTQVDGLELRQRRPGEWLTGVWVFAIRAFGLGLRVKLQS